MQTIWKTVFAQIDLKHCTIRISDGAGAYIDVKIGEGNLSYTERRTIEYTLNRGLLDEVREGDQVPMDVSLDAVWEYISGSAGSSGIPSIEDALKRRGAAASWISTDSDACRPFAVDVSILHRPRPAGCGDYEDIVLSDFRVEELSHDLRAGTISATGKCNITDAASSRYTPLPDLPDYYCIDSDSLFSVDGEYNHQKYYSCPSYSMAGGAAAVLYYDGSKWIITLGAPGDAAYKPIEYLPEYSQSVGNEYPTLGTWTGIVSISASSCAILPNVLRVTRVDAGTPSDVEGDYREDGLFNGQMSYKHPLAGYATYISYVGGSWYIRDAKGASVQSYYNGSSLTGTYTPFIGGSYTGTVSVANIP